MTSSAFSKVTFDHVGIVCSSEVFEDEIKFLNACLAPLGIKEHFRIAPLVSAMGSNPQKPDFWVSAVVKGAEIKQTTTPIHIGFRADDRSQVDEFHKLGLAAGGKDNGAPGIREQYHPGYYGGFLTSPAGNNIEVVHHDFSSLQAKD
ncbi:glyoxalase family protein [Apiospora hydei]|uniref:Glyoxalase family protein n=1 Tax=Apiospora hydei TaxID=1337664 RepID=A0ABR1X9I1_9PEZI